jgi:hypothetical protein
MNPVLIGVAVLMAALLLVLVVRSFGGGMPRNELLSLTNSFPYRARSYSSYNTGVLHRCLFFDV